MLNTSVPLCVDLNGTLTRTDLLIEGLLVLFKQKPWSIFLFAFWILRGKAYLKEQIARRVNIDVGVLPYNTKLLDYLRDEHSSGRPLYLCTASNERFAQQVASHFGMFDGIVASTGEHNLLGPNKAKALVDQFGDHGFDYCGDARSDIPVWRRARRAIVVGDHHIATAARKANAATIYFEQKRHYVPLVLEEMRIYQWVKNVLIFLPLLTAHRFTDIGAVIATCIAFASFSLCSSSVYLLNDMLDLDADRRHERKRGRPFAAGNLPLSLGMAMSVAMLAGSATLATLLPWRFGAVLAAYFATTVAYSFSLKRLPLIDVFALACLYTVRVIAGGAAGGIYLSYWLILFCVPIFLSLAMVKRYVELNGLLHAGKSELVGRGYITQDLSILCAFGTASGYLAVLVLALYVNSPEFKVLYHHPVALWVLFPLTLYWISRIWMFAFRGQMHDDPIVFTFKDNVSRAVMGLCAAAMFLAI